MRGAAASQPPSVSRRSALRVAGGRRHRPTRGVRTSRVRLRWSRHATELTACSTPTRDPRCRAPFGAPRVRTPTKGGSHAQALTYANVVATLALVFAMSGGALAASHYLINSTRQINPKVLKKLKAPHGHRPGATGATGKDGDRGAAGASGCQGEPAPPGLLATTLPAGQDRAAAATRRMRLATSPRGQISHRSIPFARHPRQRQGAPHRHW